MMWFEISSSFRFHDFTLEILNQDLRYQVFSFFFSFFFPWEFIPSTPLYCLVFQHSVDDASSIIFERDSGWVCAFFLSPAGCNGPQHLAEQFTHPPCFFIPLSYLFLPLSRDGRVKNSRVTRRSTRRLSVCLSANLLIYLRYRTIEEFLTRRRSSI